MVRTKTGEKAIAVAGAVHLFEEEWSGEKFSSFSRIPFSPWALHGRQTIMHMNSLAQRRALRKKRGRSQS